MGGCGGRRSEDREAILINDGSYNYNIIPSATEKADLFKIELFSV